MPRRFPRLLVSGILFAVAVVMFPVPPAVAQPAARPLPSNVRRACAWPPKHGYAACMALGRTDSKKNLGARPAPASLDQAYGPPDLQDAYDLPSQAAGAGQTVAIVDAYDDPKAESDMAVYRSQYGLPACTTANGCFKKVFTNGQVPSVDEGWSIEIALDLDMVSAACPNCKIRLVEAPEASNDGLLAAEFAAMELPGVYFVSNSWGEPENVAVQDQFSVFGSKPGVAVTASSGDSGYGVMFPASDPYVIAVGGTSLLRATNSRGWDEIAWSGGGSGCSAFSPKPPWQPDAESGCTNRTVVDVSAVADPSTGVYTYNTEPNAICTGWCVWGGTSAAAPLIAAVYALAGQPAHNDPAYALYVHNDQLNDVLGGTNDFSGCSPEYLCNAEPAYDGPTGLGTPEGAGAFVPTSGPYDYWP